MNATRNQKRTATVFPRNRAVLARLGENLRLARKRRKLRQRQVAERTGLSARTIYAIENGDPAVSMGHYVAVLAVLGLVEDLEAVARDDALGRKLQDIALLGKSK